MRPPTPDRQPAQAHARAGAVGRTRDRGRTVAALLLPALLLSCSAILLALGVARAQNAPEDVRRSMDEAGRRPPAFEVVERSNGEGSLATLVVGADSVDDTDPRIVVVGPDAMLLDASGFAHRVEELPPGEYVVAATAPQMRAAYGVVVVGEGEVVRVRLRLYHELLWYDDGNDVPIAGAEMDPADNEPDQKGSIAVTVEPASTVVIVGDDGFTRIVRRNDTSLAVDGVDTGVYMVAASAESMGTAFARLVVSPGATARADLELPSTGSR